MTDNSLPKVLIVEDSFPIQRFYREKLDGQCYVISAHSVKDGEMLFRMHPDVAAIVMDACVPGETPTTQPLVKHIRRTFSGPIIAASGSEECQKMLLKAGCDHRVSKREVPGKLAELLEQNGD